MHESAGLYIFVFVAGFLAGTIVQQIAHSKQCIEDSDSDDDLEYDWIVPSEIRWRYVNNNSTHN